MAYFRVVGSGAQAPEPIEKLAATALEAEAQHNLLRRLCGRSGKVQVWGKTGREISPETLRRLAQEEQAASLQPSAAAPMD